MSACILRNNGVKVIVNPHNDSRNSNNKALMGFTHAGNYSFTWTIPDEVRIPVTGR